VREDIPCFTTELGFRLDIMNAKIYKILPHKFFYSEYSIWVDGNIFLTVEPDKVLELLGDADIAVFKHASRTNVYEEAEAIKHYYPQYTDTVDEQINFYKQIGVPDTLPLAECPVLIRKQSPIMDAFCEAWWAEICRFSPRDQLSFPVTVANFPEMKVRYIENEGGIYTHPYFKRINHNG
jgi:hypothetical protein